MKVESYTCEIISTGLSPEGNAIVELKSVDGKFEKTLWGVPNPAFKKELLAIALMALSTNKQVLVEFPDDPKPPNQYTQFTKLLVLRGY